MAQSTLTKIKSSPAVLSQKPKSKRRDIQGLRAIAVLVVVFDHLVHWPSGGFVGVDVFFVISGFLITGLLLREYDQTGTISFAGFYRRRIRRIMPAAMTVLAATSAAAYWIFSEARARETLVDAVWSLLFAANWHFSAVGTDYFQASGPISPLQHFWSLAVEEQFYLIWPWPMVFIFWIGSKSAKWDKARAHRAIGVTMVAIVALSFAWALYQSAANPTSAYFSTFTRAWELGVGALVAVIAPAFHRIPDRIRPAIAWLGVAGIIWSVFAISAEASFPAPWAAVPVLATALVIIAGTGGEQRFLGLLTNKVAGYVGGISYSLYLWHFPVIILAQAFLPDQTPEFYAAALVAMLALSIASFHLVEEPIRRSEWLLPKSRKDRRQKPQKDYRAPQYIGLAVLSAVTAVVCTAALMGASPFQAPATPAASASMAAAAAPSATPQTVDTTPEGVLSAQIVAALASRDFPEFTPAIESLGTENWAKRPEIACMNVNGGNVASCLTGPAEATKTAAVLGDSFAVAWLPGIRAALEPLGYKVQALTMGQCPAATVKVTMEGGAAFPACEAHQQWALDSVRAMHPDFTILASAQGSTMRRLASGKTGQDAVAEMVAGLEKTVTEVAGSTGRVAVLGSPPTGKSLQTCVTKVANPGSCISELTDEWRSLSDAEKKVIPGPGVTYVDTVSWFCHSNGYCPGFVGKTPVRVDTGHMTVEYSQKLAPLLSKALAG
ncbi:acyltransferase family protein [Pseudarthrobacter sp. H2]|uniref:acyltransferase family protein n=1 Tax=Pseudarthrobacter sp. H2 TaxID=3418415 RepID=UPI003CEB1B64